MQKKRSSSFSKVISLIVIIILTLFVSGYLPAAIGWGIEYCPGLFVVLIIALILDILLIVNFFTPFLSKRRLAMQRESIERKTITTEDIPQNSFNTKISVKYCPFCGAKNDDVSKSCINCENPINK